MNIASHSVRAGGAVESQKGQREGGEGCNDRSDTGADQQCAGGLDGNRDSHGGGDPHIGALVKGRDEGGLDLEQVLAGFDYEKVHAPLYEALDLEPVGIIELIKADLPQGGEPCSRAHGTCNVTRFLLV